MPQLLTMELSKGLARLGRSTELDPTQGDWEASKSQQINPNKEVAETSTDLRFSKGIKGDFPSHCSNVNTAFPGPFLPLIRPVYKHYPRLLKERLKRSHPK